MSKFTKYEAVSPELYENYTRSSLYVPGFDGTKLALDYMLPADENGQAIDGRFPTILMGSRGGRFSMLTPDYPGNYFNGNGPLALYLIARGYAYVVVEMRGCGASFGVNNSFASHENRADVAAIIDWITAQPWSDGNVGMMGASNRAFIQWCTAAEMTPQRLKAITPTVANANFYFTNFPNGVSRIANPGKMPDGTKKSDMLTKEQFLKIVTPVDDDPDGETAYRAYCEDQYPNNINFMRRLIKPNMCRDDVNEEFNCQPNLELSALQFTERFINSPIKLHQTAGWFDMSVGSQIAFCNSWGGSILIGPWSHQGTECGTYRPEKYPDETYNIGEEHKRWFDYSVKGEPGEWSKQPKFHYYTIGAEKGHHWRWSDSFPLKETIYTTKFLTGEKAGAIDSVNDGTLSSQKPSITSKDNYKVDLGIHFFEETDISAVYEPFSDAKYKETYNTFAREWDGDMSKGADLRSLTYTSEPLQKGDLLEMTGFPMVELWVSSQDVNDADFIAVLEEVSPDGRSTYITDGVMRASHRTIGPNTVWDSTGLPYHPSTRATVDEKLKEGISAPVCLKFNMEPISYCFKEGSRVRLTVFCAEMITYQHPMYDQKNPPNICVHVGGEYASSLTLPMIPKRKHPYPDPAN